MTDAPNIIGLDPGVTTGYAVWDRIKRTLLRVESMAIHQAMAVILAHREAGSLHMVVFEDARLRTGYFGPNARAKEQGAGSVKRDCKIWSDFLHDHGIAHLAISPKRKGAKLDAQRFAKLTGWASKTNEHGRDAAMLIFGR